jgi:hypothetical protein
MTTTGHEISAAPWAEAATVCGYHTTDGPCEFCEALVVVLKGLAGVAGIAAGYLIGVSDR